jgi:hypothetical protein
MGVIGFDDRAFENAVVLHGQAAELRASSRRLRARARRMRMFRHGGVSGGAGSDDQRTLIAHVRSALALKTLPLATKHTGMGAGSGLPCVVCGLRLDPKDMECRMGSRGRVHLVCYLIWIVESRRLDGVDEQHQGRT